MGDRHPESKRHWWNPLHPDRSGLGAGEHGQLAGCCGLWSACCWARTGPSADSWWPGRTCRPETVTAGATAGETGDVPRPRRRLRLTCVVVLAGLTLAGCTGDSGPTTAVPIRVAGTQPTQPVPSRSAGAGSSAASASPRPATTTVNPAPTTTAPNPVSIQALIDRTYDGSGLRLGAERGSTSAYRHWPRWAPPGAPAGGWRHPRLCTSRGWERSSGPP